MRDIVRTFRLATLVALAIGANAAADDLQDTLAAESNSGPTSYDLSDLLQPPIAGANTAQRESFSAFAEALANRSYSEAEISAKHMVELVTVDDSISDVDAAHARARALQNLAIAQQMSGSHESARQNYFAALDLIASKDNNLSPALIAPLRGLAIAHLDSGQSREAFEAFDRATHVSNVNFGPHSLKQLPIINTKMGIYLERNDFPSALAMLDRLYMLYSRQYPRNSEEILPAVYKQVEIYSQLGMYGDERHALRHVLTIKEKTYAEDDPALIDPHMRIAENLVRSMLRDDFRSVTSSTAERHLKTALQIAENAPEDQWEIRKDCLLSLADFYTLFDMKGRARRYYGKAWKLMSSNESYLASRAEDLEAPVPLARPAPDLYANFEYNPDRDKLSADDYLEGEVVLAFTVNDRGRTEDLRIVKADPENFTEMEARLRNAVKEFAYRPRLADGKAIATPDMQHRFRYFYTPTEYQASLDKAARPRSPWQSRKP